MESVTVVSVEGFHWKLCESYASLQTAIDMPTNFITAGYRGCWGTDWAVSQAAGEPGPVLRGMKQ